MNSTTPEQIAKECVKIAFDREFGEGGWIDDDRLINDLYAAITTAIQHAQRDAWEQAAQIVEQPFQYMSHSKEANERVKLVNDLASQIRWLKNEPKKIRRLS